MGTSNMQGNTYPANRDKEGGNGTLGMQWEIHHTTYPDGMAKKPQSIKMSRMEWREVVNQ